MISPSRTMTAPTGTSPASAPAFARASASRMKSSYKRQSALILERDHDAKRHAAEIVLAEQSHRASGRIDFRGPVPDFSAGRNVTRHGHLESTKEHKAEVALIHTLVVIVVFRLF